MATTAIEKTKQPELPEPVMRRGLSEAQWRTLCDSLYPGASPRSVLMVIDYCAARKLDPMKKPCHIVPMEVKIGDRYEWRDVILPGIYELRTTAQRTGEYLGHDKAVYGPLIDVKGVKAPEYCEFTVYRWNELAKTRVAFPVQTFFREVVATKRDGTPNARWAKAPIQMLTKTAEAAALREAFPDELGGQQVEEELSGQRNIEIGGTLEVDSKPALPKPDGFEESVLALAAAAEQGVTTLEAAWTKTALAHRNYLTATEPEALEQLKARAAECDVLRAESKPKGDAPTKAKNVE